VPYESGSRLSLGKHFCWLNQYPETAILVLEDLEVLETIGVEEAECLQPSAFSLQPSAVRKFKMRYKT